MRGDHLVKHMRTHEKKPNSKDQVTEYNFTMYDNALENELMWGDNEYRRKI